MYTHVFHEGGGGGGREGEEEEQLGSSLAPCRALSTHSSMRYAPCMASDQFFSLGGSQGHHHNGYYCTPSGLIPDTSVQ
jgi:hypothetical protein